MAFVTFYAHRLPCGCPRHVLAALRVQQRVRQQAPDAALTVAIAAAQRQLPAGEVAAAAGRVRDLATNATAAAA